MAWDHLSINKPHLVYLILGGFTSLFMLCSSLIKERLYIGEATVATIVGVIFGPHAANLIDPGTWGNVVQITLEFSRIVLVVQCFAVGVELPKYYMEKHWRSVVLLLLPVMTFGWLVTSLFVWWMVPSLDWLESLCVAACVTATDPVLASSVVGKGKFAKRVPKHLRDLLSAESGCNDGMAFPFIYLALYIIHYQTQPKEVAFHWIVISVLYECVFGAIYGFTIGWISRHGIKYAEKHDLVDRESFLVFYFVLALFCAGSGSLLGMDDLLIGFAAGVGFSNDGWFTQKTEESHVSNVIDLLLNLAYFVFLGTIIPWEQFNSAVLGLTPWRLVVIAIFVILFRRIPIMMLLKPIIPDITTWREALFAGHFGPIGVGAIFVSILARADLETDGGSTPLAELPDPSSPHYNLIALIWPITTFLVISSIIVHGSSIAVFTLGKHINTLTLTMSYTRADEDGPSWMSRLPRIASQSKSMTKASDTTDIDERMDPIQPGSLPPVGMPGTFLRRQREEDNPSRQGSRASSLVPTRRRKKRWLESGGPVSQSAITPQRRTDSENTSVTLKQENSDPRSQDGQLEKELEDEKELGEIQNDPEMHEILYRHEDEEEKDQHKSDAERHPGQTETYVEGTEMITENEDGDVLTVQKTPQSPDERREEEISKVGLAAPKDEIASTPNGYKNIRKKLENWIYRSEEQPEGSGKHRKESERKRGPALAYQFGNTIIVEDADGEVVKKYELPSYKYTKKSEADGEGGGLRQGLTRMSAWNAKKKGLEESEQGPVRQGLSRISTWTGLGPKKEEQIADGSTPEPQRRGRKTRAEEENDDRHIRFTIGGAGRRMTKEDFLKEIQSLDPKARAKIVNESTAPEEMKDLARKDASPSMGGDSRLYEVKDPKLGSSRREAKQVAAQMAKEKGAEVDDEDIDSEMSTEESVTPRGREDFRDAAIASRHREYAKKDRLVDEHFAADSHVRAATSSDLAKIDTPSQQVPETPAERRRREDVLSGLDDENPPRFPQQALPRFQQERPHLAPTSPSDRSPQEHVASETHAERRRREAIAAVAASSSRDEDRGRSPPSETMAEKRRREAALGVNNNVVDSDSDDDNTERVPQAKKRPGIRFAEEPIRGRK